MKIITLFVLVILSFFISCSKKDIKIEYLVNSTIETYKNELPKKIIFYRDKNNINIKNSKNYIFLDGKNLLEQKDESFLSLYVKDDNKFKIVGILSFKTGKGLKCVFDKKGKLISKNIIQTKLEPSKPYYIYHEILKRKYPNYMNWDLFPIPQDSLK